MKRMIVLGASLMLAAGTAFASHCPKDMKMIDDALAKSPKLSDAQMKEVKDQRAKGEAAHKAGDHKGAEEALHKAMTTLGVKHP